METQQEPEQTHSKSTHQVRTGILLAIVGTFLFALKSIFIKLAFASGANPTTLLTLRLIFSLPFYVGTLIYFSRDPKQPVMKRRQIAQACMLGFLGYYLASFLDLSGLEYISAQLERLTLFTYPTIIAVLAWMFLGETLNRKIITAIILCYVGVFVMYRGEQAIELNSNTTLGVLLVMAAALSYSFYVLFAKPAMQAAGSRQFTCWAMLGSTFFIATHFFATEPVTTIIQLSPIVYVYGFILAVVCTVIPSFMINEAIVRLGATRTSVIGSLGPVLTMALALVVLNEPSSWKHFAGMGMVIVGVSFVAK